MSSPPATPTNHGVIVHLGSAVGSAGLGGKAASLDRLAKLGHAVPPGLCLTADAFRTQLAAVVAGAPAVAAALAALPDEAARSELVAAFGATPTEPELAAALADGVARLGAALAGATSGGLAGEEARFAVRSSALDEDGSLASFAGLHETELGRRPDEVEGAVRRCWASLWSQPAVAYRSRRGLPFDDLAMAVVVQALVPADASAVVFTRHPVTGRDDQVLVTAIRGLGEPMVSGLATPDTIVVDRASRAVVERDPGRPGPRLFMRPGGLVEIPDPGTGPALDADALDELVGLALAVDEAYGERVDIEAARAGGRWLLLQARPITTR